jgi:hypothetical protein
MVQPHVNSNHRADRYATSPTQASTAVRGVLIDLCGGAYSYWWWYTIH